jgi:hypothetical protein
VNATLLLPEGKYIKSASFNGKEPTLTIAAASWDEVDKGEFKGVVTFKEKSKRTEKPLQWLLNTTNTKALIAMFGLETDEWVGKRVTLYSQPMTDPFTKLPTTGIRVRGSPDLTKEVRFAMRLRGRAPEIHALVKTGAKEPQP